MANEKRLIALETLIDNIDWDNDLQKWTLRGDPEDIPTVEAVEVVHGRWEYIHEGRYLKVRCTACGRDVINVDTAVYDIMYPLIKWAYCPNCCAKMDGDGNA